MTDQITKAPFGTAPDGMPVDIYTLRNSRGMEARITTYGGIVVSLTAPDRHGKFTDVALGHDTLDGYLKRSPYFGAIIGRYANRIANGKFKLNDREYTLAVNNGPNSLHGGLKGFDKAVWRAMTALSPDGPALELTHVSPDGEEGYPGTLKIKVVYTLTEDNALRFDCTATTDQPTVLNLTQHSYFNLAGSGDVLGHEAFIDADRFVPVDETLIPTGELRPVRGTPFDFNQPMAIGARIGQDDVQIKYGRGYDHTWVLNHPPGKLGLAARVGEPTSGRVLELWTTEPGLQFYTGNFLDGTITGKGGRVYRQRNGFCLEAQHFPDSPNQPKFPGVVLSPGQVYRNMIIFKFPTPALDEGPV